MAGFKTPTIAGEQDTNYVVMASLSGLRLTPIMQALENKHTTFQGEQGPAKKFEQAFRAEIKSPDPTGKKPAEMYTAMRQGGYDDATATKECDAAFIYANTATRINPEHRKQYEELFNKGATAEQLLAQLDKWGYNDLVRQLHDRLTTYESLISTLANQYAAQMAAARQAQQFQMTSTTQQLQAIVDFVEKMVKEKKEQARNEKPESQETTAKKRKKKAEAAEELLRDIESGEKPAVTPFAKNKLYDEVEKAQTAKDGLKVSELINNSKFQAIYEDHRTEELHGALKDLVPSKLGEVADVMKAGQGGQRVNLSKYDIAIQTALVVA